MADVVAGRKNNKHAVIQRRRTRLNKIIKYIDSTNEPFWKIDIARATGLPYTSVWRLLPYLENRGVLLAEDHRGMLMKLPPFDPDRDY